MPTKAKASSASFRLEPGSKGINKLESAGHTGDFQVALACLKGEWQRANHATRGDHTLSARRM